MRHCRAQNLSARVPAGNVRGGRSSHPAGKRSATTQGRTGGPGPWSGLRAIWPDNSLHHGGGDPHVPGAATAPQGNSMKICKLLCPSMPKGPCRAGQITAENLYHRGPVGTGTQFLQDKQTEDSPSPRGSAPESAAPV